MKTKIATFVLLATMSAFPAYATTSVFDKYATGLVDRLLDEAPNMRTCHVYTETEQMQFLLEYVDKTATIILEERIKFGLDPNYFTEIDEIALHYEPIFAYDCTDGSYPNWEADTRHRAQKILTFGKNMTTSRGH